MPELPLHVIRERQFERELRALIREARAADAFVEAGEFVLAHDPVSGTQLAPDVWFMPMAPVNGRQVAIYYTFDDATLWLLSIR